MMAGGNVFSNFDAEREGSCVLAGHREKPRLGAVARGPPVKALPLIRDGPSPFRPYYALFMSAYGPYAAHGSAF